MLNMLLLDSSSDDDSYFENSTESDDDDDSFFVYFAKQQELLLQTQPVPVKKKRKITHIKGFLEDEVPLYNENEFKRNFRISKVNYDYLCKQFKSYEQFKKLRHDKRFSAEKHLLIFLWFAGKQICSYRNISKHFHIAISSIGSILKRVIEFICSMGPKVIKWPNENEKKVTSEFLLQKTGITNLIGIIGTTHISIDPPDNKKGESIVKKFDDALCLQATCDEKKKFTSIFVGHPESFHNNSAFENSPIYPELKSLCGIYYILGDSTYPNIEYLITPYKDNGNLTETQEHFNIKLNSARAMIEDSFKNLKKRFRQLYYCRLKGISKLCDFINACCILHNIFIDDDLNFTNFDSCEDE